QVFIIDEIIDRRVCLIFFFVTDPPTPEIYTLSLHDALPILGSVAIAVSSVWPSRSLRSSSDRKLRMIGSWKDPAFGFDCSGGLRSEEHTSELQSRSDLVCRLLLEKKK